MRIYYRSGVLIDENFEAYRVLLLKDGERRVNVFLRWDGSRWRKEPNAAWRTRGL